MKTIKLQPVEGRYGTVVDPDYPAKGAGTLMSAAQLALCLDSDDTRLSTASGGNNRPYQQFRFDLSGHTVDRVKEITASWEGYVFDTTHHATGLYSYLDAGTWHQEHFHWNEFDTVIEDELDDLPLDDYIDGAGMLWLLAFNPQRPNAATLHTDQVKLILDLPSLVEAVSPFGQRYRLFDDLDANSISFQRQDTPGGEWSSPTQPFGVTAEHSPALEWLPNGLLRAAYIDAGGALRHRISRDDGATWVTP